jgi:hypothetical protein
MRHQIIILEQTGERTTKKGHTWAIYRGVRRCIYRAAIRAQRLLVLNPNYFR